MTERRLAVEEYQVVESTVALLNGQYTQVVAQDPTRAMVLFSVPAGSNNDVYVSTKQTLSQNRGVHLQPTTNPIPFTWQEMGAWVTGPLFATSGAGNPVITVIELLYRPGAQNVVTGSDT